MLKYLLASVFLLFALTVTGVGADAAGNDGRPLVVAHRGASGYLPEHTLAAYAMAYGQGADMIEPDVVATRDGELVCLHDLTLESTTDVRTIFPGRSREDGRWYAIDFTMEELRRLSKHGRDGEHPGHRIATLDEMLTLIARLNERSGRTVGVVPEMKHPEFHLEHGIDLAAATLSVLGRHGYTRRTDPIFLQCFHEPTLWRVRHELGSDLPLMFLSGDPVSDEKLRSIGTWCDALGINRRHLDPVEGGDPRKVVTAQRAGLLVVPYTLKDDAGQIRRLFEIGVDGVFADFPDIALRVRAEGG